MPFHVLPNLHLHIPRTHRSCSSPSTCLLRALPASSYAPFRGVKQGAALRRTHGQRASCAAGAAAPEEISGYQTSLWGDYFLTYQPKPLQRSEQWMSVRADKLKEEVCVLFKTCRNTTEMTALLYTVQRLGIDHHFKQHIDGVLSEILETDFCSSSLHEVAMRFCLLREHGLWVSPDVFNTFKNEGGSFNEDITNDPRGLLTLYNAAHFLIHGETSLEEAISYARHHLELMIDSLKSPLAEQVKRALHLPLPRTVKRVETVHYIAEYINEDGHNPTLLELAKLDFNLLQHVHLKELKYLTKWSIDFFGYVELNYVRERMVESYFGPYAVYHEKEFSLSRIFFTKLMVLMAVIDDTYDAHATIEEIRQLHVAIQRWDESTPSLLPEYLKRFYNEIMRTFKDAEGEAFIDTYHLAYARKALQNYSSYHIQEAEWSHLNHKPSFEDFLNLSAKSVGLPSLSVVLLVGMGDAVSKEVFEWVTGCPDIIRAGGKILRLFDDLAAQDQKAKGDVASCLETYMVEHRVTSEVAIPRIHSLIEAEWKTINEAHFEHRALLPVVKRISNLINTGTIYYADQKDGFTFGVHIQETIERLFVNPIPM